MAGLLTRLRGGRKPPEAEAAPTDPIAAAEARLVTAAQDLAAARQELARRLASGEPVSEAEVLASSPHADDRAELRGMVEAIRETRGQRTKAAALPALRERLAAARQKVEAHRAAHAETLRRIAADSHELGLEVDRLTRDLAAAEVARGKALAAAPEHVRARVLEAAQARERVEGQAGSLRQQVEWTETQLSRARAEVVSLQQAIATCGYGEHTRKATLADHLAAKQARVAELEAFDAKAALKQADALEAGELVKAREVDAEAWAALDAL